MTTYLLQKINMAGAVLLLYSIHYMAYALLTGRTPMAGRNLHTDHAICDCSDARRSCAPPFVFSVRGQVRFRAALFHVHTCRARSCRDLKRTVVRGMSSKLHWLFDHDVLLGCVHAQPLLYGASRVIFNHQQFTPVARHLSRCPKESCAQLRRAVLLTIRDLVNPKPVSGQ